MSVSSCDRKMELSAVNTETSGTLLSLPIPGFPFDLAKRGYYNFADVAHFSLGFVPNYRLSWKERVTGRFIR